MVASYFPSYVLSLYARELFLTSNLQLWPHTSISFGAKDHSAEEREELKDSDEESSSGNNSDEESNNSDETASRVWYCVRC